MMPLIWPTIRSPGLVLLLAVATLITPAPAPAPALAQGESSAAAHQQFVFAYRLLQRGEDAQAAQAFDEFLGKFPRDVKRNDAAYYRAVIAHRTGDNQRAASLLESVTVTTLAPADAVALLKGQVFIETARFDDALKALEPLSAPSLAPEIGASVLRLRGVAYRRLGNLEGAAAQLRQAADMETSVRPAAMLDLARVLARQNKLDDALAALGEAIRSTDANVASEAGRLAGDLCYEAGRFDQAAEYYYTVMQRWQTSRAFGPSVVGALWSRFSAKRYEEVAATFDALKGNLAEHADRLEAWYLGGSALRELGKYDQAAARLTELLTSGVSGERREKTLFKLAQCLLETARYDELRQRLDQLAREFPDSQLKSDIAFLRAAALAREGRGPAAAAALAAIIDAGPAHPYYGDALLQRAAVYEQTADLEPAIADIEKYLALSDDRRPAPQSHRATLRLIDMLHRRGRFEEAARYAQTLSGIEGLSDGVADPLIEQEALYRLALARVQLKQFAGALSALETLLARHPQSAFKTEAWYYRGLLKMTQGDRDAAVLDLLAAGREDALDRALRVNALRLAAIRLRERGDDQQAAETLDELAALIGQVGLNADERLWFARYELARGRPEHAMVYATSIAEKRTGASPDQRGEALMVIGRSRQAMGQLPEAQAAFEQIVAEGLGDVLAARLELARTHSTAGDDERALGEYAGLLTAASSSVAAAALFETAMIHLARAEKPGTTQADRASAHETARGQLKRLVVLYGDPALSPLPEKGLIELAELAERQGDTAAAIQHAEELVRLFPDGPFAMYAKACAFQWRGRLGEAVFWLKKAAEALNTTPQARELAPRIALRLEAVYAQGGAP